MRKYRRNNKRFIEMCIRDSCGCDGRRADIRLYRSPARRNERGRNDGGLGAYPVRRTGRNFQPYYQRGTAHQPYCV